MRKWTTHNLLLKLIALGLAITTWLYVNWELLKPGVGYQMPDFRKNSVSRNP